MKKIKEFSEVENIYVEVHGMCPSIEKNISLHSYNEVISLMAMVEKECFKKIQEICDEEYSSDEKMADILKYIGKNKHDSKPSGTLPPLQVGSKFSVCGGGYVRYATVVEIDIGINVSPLVDKYFTVKLEKYS